MSLGFTERDEAQLLAERAPDLLARLQVLTGALAGALSEGDVAEALVEQAVEALGAAAGVVAIDDGLGLLHVAASRGYPDDLMERWQAIPIDTPVPIADSVRKRRPIYILSLEERDRLYPILAHENAENSAFLIVPFVIEERALGALALSFSGSKALLEVDKTFMLAVAQQGAVALERARLYDGEFDARREAERATARQQFLARTTEVLASTLELGAVLDQLARLAVPTLADWCIVYLTDDDGKVRRVALEQSDPERAPLAERIRTSFTIDTSRESGLARVLRAGEAQFHPKATAELLAADVDDPSALQKLLEPLGISSWICVPISHGRDVFGAISFVGVGAREYTIADLELAEDVGRGAALAIDNARLFRGVARAERDSRFQRLLLESQSEATIDGILVVSPEGEILFFNKRFADMWGISDEVLASRSDESAIAAVADQIEDPDAFLARVRWLYENPDRSSRDEVRLKDGRIFDRWSAPLVTEGVTYGRAWYFRDVTPERRMEERLALEERRSAFLADISALLAGARDERALFSEMAERVVPFLADWCIVDLAQPNGTVDRVAVANTDTAMIELAKRVLLRRHYTVDPEAKRGVPKVLRTGETDYGLEIPDTWIEQVAGNSEYLQLLKAIGFRSFVSVPLMTRGRVLGAITMVTAESGRTLTRADVTFAEEIGRRASIALENLRLLADRSAAAHSLQESLLPPHLPLIPNVALAARYRAAGEGNDVGGDFYDVFPAASGGWAVVVGDVCGKGPEAAALTALVRYTIRTLSMQMRKPRRILARLNDAILSQRSDGRFSTLVYGRLDLTTEGEVSLRLCSGGHPLPVLVRANGDVRTIGRPGTLLGVFPEARSPETSVHLAPGDAIVLYTDGVTEARSASGTMGESGLLDVLRSCGGAEASAIAQRVDQAVRDFQDGEQRDDIAVLVVQAAPPQAEETALT